MIGLNLKKIITLNNTYLIKEKDLKTALDQMDQFRDKMQTFQDKYPNYNYKVLINALDEVEGWIIELTINNNEKRKTQTS